MAFDADIIYINNNKTIHIAIQNYVGFENGLSITNIPTVNSNQSKTYNIF